MREFLKTENNLEKLVIYESKIKILESRILFIFRKSIIKKKKINNKKNNKYKYYEEV